MMQRLNELDTIVAISSPAGSALRSIVRLSGPMAWEISAKKLVGNVPEKPGRSCAVPGFWQSGQSAPASVQIQFWPAGRSYTGQELVEWHLSCPNPVAELLLDSLVKSGARPAEPGEFSLRAFLSGRIDLTRAEAISGIFQSVTEQQLEVALDQLAGGLAARIDRLRDRLLDLLAWIEATLDFVEESDVSPITRSLIGEELLDASNDLAQLANQWTDRRTVSGSERVLLVGVPNAGKSALFNALSTGSQALVSPVAGTTRDYLEASIKLGKNRQVHLIDTAGIADSPDVLDTSAQTIGQREHQLADLILLCHALDESGDADFQGLVEKLPENIPVLRVGTKCDIARNLMSEKNFDVLVSSMTNEGLDELRERIRLSLDREAQETVSVLGTTIARTRQSLQTASESLAHAAGTILTDFGDELVAMDLRMAVESLDLITGRDVTEETLDRVFSRFCIGK